MDADVTPDLPAPFVDGFVDELLKQAGLTSTIKALLGLPGPARSLLRADPLKDPSFARELAATFGTAPGAARDGRGVLRFGGTRPRPRGTGAAGSMLIGRPGSRYYRGNLAKAGLDACALATAPMAQR